MLTALQHIQLHRVLKAREVWLCLCLVSCYRKRHVMGERGESVGGVGERGERQRGRVRNYRRRLL